MARGRVIALSGIALALLLCAAPAQAEQGLLKKAAKGDPKVQSIEAIAFGPEGLLLIGDGRGAQLVAVATGDTTPQAWSKTEVPQLQEKLAGRLGTTAKGIEITKLAVNPASQKAYFAVRKLDDKKDLILTVDGAGKVSEFPLDNVKYARVSLVAGPKAVKTVTDVAWANDRVLVTAQADETFGSKIFTVPVPLENDAKQAANSTETYHVAHGKWETQAPIRTVLPYTENGKKYLVGTFTCTPLVKYSLDDLKPDGKVKGVSVLELGFGNQPRDMFTYEKDGKHYILMATYRKFHAKAPVGPSNTLLAPDSSYCYSSWLSEGRLTAFCTTPSLRYSRTCMAI